MEASPLQPLRSARTTDRPSPLLTTFYSFKGGVGRTQSMFNVAARLAALRRKVLMVDVDLEAPGLSIGLLDEEARRKKEGFAEIAEALLHDLKVAFRANEDAEYFDALLDDFRARVQRALHEIDPLPMPPKKQELAQRFQEQFDFFTEPTGALSLLSTGRIRKDYTQQVAQLPLADAYNDPLGAPMQAVVSSLVDEFATPVDPERLSTRGHVFAAFVRELLHTAHVPDRDETFDHVLIDARSGLADVGGLCLIGLADARVVLTGLNEQNITGTEMVLDDVSGVDPHARDEDRLIVVFSPVPEGEVQLLEDRLSDAKETLDVDAEQTHLLHYHPRIALEEKAFAEPIHEHTRIYDEYEALTNRLLALTQSDARTLVSDALDRFRESGPDEEDADEENRYEQLVTELIPAAFLDADHVESVVDGLCSQMERSGPYELEALVLFDLWTALSPEEVRVLGTTANYYCKVGIENASELGEDAIESLFQRGFNLYRRIADQYPKEERTWYNWGTYLAHLARLVQADEPDRAEPLYIEAFDKFECAVDVDPDLHEAWYNWGNNLGKLAQLVQHDDPDRAASLDLDAFDKYERAVDVKPDKHEAWLNWGTDLAHLAGLVQHDDSDRAKSLYLDALDKFERAVELESDEHDAWYNWGLAHANLAQLVQDDNPDRAESLYLDAFDKFERAVDLNSDLHQAWYNWGIDLVRWSRLCRTYRDADQADTALTEAIHKLRRSLEHGGDARSVFWLIFAHAERGRDEDIETAAELIQSPLDEAPEFVTVFEIDDAAAVREQPELRAILDRYREQIDAKANAVGDVDDLDADLDAMD